MADGVTDRNGVWHPNESALRWAEWAAAATTDTVPDLYIGQHHPNGTVADRPWWYHPDGSLHDYPDEQPRGGRMYLEGGSSEDA